MHQTEGELVKATGLRLMGAYRSGDWDEVYSIAYGICRAGDVLNIAGRISDRDLLIHNGQQLISARNMGDWHSVYDGIVGVAALMRDRYQDQLSADYEAELAACARIHAVQLGS